jgi:DNA/RNA endonuclease YhcR with UshA esterase domain
MMRAEDGTVSVHLGPKRFFDERDFAIMPGDALEVTGRLAKYRGDQVVVATAVKKGPAELRLPNRTSPSGGSSD